MPCTAKTRNYRGTGAAPYQQEEQELRDSLNNPITSSTTAGAAAEGATYAGRMGYLLYCSRVGDDVDLIWSILRMGADAAVETTTTNHANIYSIALHSIA